MPARRLCGLAGLFYMADAAAAAAALAPASRRYDFTNRGEIFCPGYSGRGDAACAHTHTRRLSLTHSLTLFHYCCFSLDGTASPQNNNIKHQQQHQQQPTFPCIYLHLASPSSSFLFSQLDSKIQLDWTLELFLAYCVSRECQCKWCRPRLAKLVRIGAMNAQSSSNCAPT